MDFLTESKNVHLEHLEDLVFEGVAGTRQAISYLQSLREMLKGTADRPINVTVKWDGAPAIIAGINPENGRFFVGTKGVFNKVAKLNYTEEDIDRNHPGGGLNQKLKLALQYLPELGLDGVYQGDMLFTSSDIQTETIAGEPHLTFQPNTILYAVPTNSHLAKIIQSSKIGIVWHTKYTGSTIGDLHASFGVNSNHFNQSRNVWSHDATFKDLSGTVTFTHDESDKVTQLLSYVGTLFNRLSPGFLNKIATIETFKIQIKTYNNTKVRQGQRVTNYAAHTQGLFQFVEAQLNNNIAGAKKEDVIRNRTIIKNRTMGFYRGNQEQFKILFELQSLLVDAKNVILSKMSKLEQSTQSFMKTSDGYKVTSPEGFVAIDHMGNAVKLVDRLTFSHQNFTQPKNWKK